MTALDVNLTSSFVAKVDILGWGLGTGGWGLGKLFGDSDHSSRR
ncbi:MAG: hypothetical protein V7K67_16450 [Nostoc sp.]